VSLQVRFERHERSFVMHDREKVHPLTWIVRFVIAFVRHDLGPRTPLRAIVVAPELEAKGHGDEPPESDAKIAAPRVGSSSST
jgi:hypothetical protein